MTLFGQTRTSLPSFLVIAVWISLVSLSGDLRAADSVTEIALQNPVLRELFEDEVTRSRSFRMRFGRRRLDPLSQEQIHRYISFQVDRRIRYFVLELQQRRRKLFDELALLSGLHRRATAPSPHPQARIAFRASLRRASEYAGDLRGMLKPVLSAFDGKPAAPVEVSSFAVTGFDKEMEQLETLAEKLNQRIESYFFKPSHTVTVGDLTGGNMLTELRQIKDLTQMMERSLR